MTSPKETNKVLKSGPKEMEICSLSDKEIRKILKKKKKKFST